MIPASLRRLSRPGLVLLALFAAGSVRAQTLAGFDDFNDNSLSVGVGERWRFDAELDGTGLTAYTETNQQMQFTSTATSGQNSRALGWISPSSSGGAYGINWTATVSATNTTSPTTGFTYAGLEAYTVTDPGAGVQSNAYYGIYIRQNSSGAALVTEWGSWVGDADAGSWDRHTSSLALGSSSDVLLSFGWDASSQELTASFSTDNGLNYTTGQTFALSGAEAGPGSPWMNGFGIELSSVANSAAVSAGQISYDNMSVSAVPEPSTYAALAGAAVLGLAFWRRRAKGAIQA